MSSCEYISFIQHGLYKNVAASWLGTVTKRIVCCIDSVEWHKSKYKKLVYCRQYSHGTNFYIENKMVSSIKMSRNRLVNIIVPYGVLPNPNTQTTPLSRNANSKKFHENDHAMSRWNCQWNLSRIVSRNVT